MTDESVKQKEETPSVPTNDELLANIAENPKETLKELNKKRLSAQKNEQTIKDLTLKLKESTGKLTAKDKAEAEAEAKKKAENGEFETLLAESNAKLTENEKTILNQTEELDVYKARDKAKSEALYTKLTEAAPELAKAFSIETPIEQLEAILNSTKSKKGFDGVPPPNLQHGGKKLDVSKMTPSERFRYKSMMNTQQ
jgi:hypothetical protein